MCSCLIARMQDKIVLQLFIHHSHHTKTCHMLVMLLYIFKKSWFNKSCILKIYHYTKFKDHMLNDSGIVPTLEVCKATVFILSVARN